MKTSLSFEEDQYYECRKILHCEESDGVIDQCHRCEGNYQLINEICVKVNHQELDICQEFSKNNNRK